MVTIIQPLFTVEQTAALTRILRYLEDEQADYITRSLEERTEHIYHSVLLLRTSRCCNSDLFDGGKTSSTPGAIAAIEKAKQQPWEFLCRHLTGDWGDLCADDWRVNDFALEHGFRLLSSYRTKDGERLWVITEADRSVTTLLLPTEY